jgi:hypothetical protein
MDAAQVDRTLIQDRLRLTVAERAELGVLEWERTRPFVRGHSPRVFDPARMLRTLMDHEVRFVVIHGFAAVLRGSPVITGNLNIQPTPPGAANFARLASAVQDLEVRTERGEPVAINPDSLKRYTLFFSTTAGDLLGDVFPAGARGLDLYERGSDEDIGGFAVRVASLEDLIRMLPTRGHSKGMIAREWLCAVRDEIEGRG